MCLSPVIVIGPVLGASQAEGLTYVGQADASLNRGRYSNRLLPKGLQNYRSGRGSQQMKSTYWSDVLRKQISRRRALVATGATAASAAVLAACGSSKGGGGGSSAGSGGANDKSGLISTPVDTTKQARRGGVARWFQANEPAHMDIHIGLAPLNTPNNLVNDNLVNEKAGSLTPAEYSEVIPDLAESWEWSPDRLQLTFKLRPGIKWHNKAPVNGRAFDVEDVVNSWNRFAVKGQGRATVSNAANPNAPVLSAMAL